jgi:uncharacterized protein (DUF4415 family)
MADAQTGLDEIDDDADDAATNHAGRRNKERVTVRLDPDVLNHFRRDGKGYQTRLNAALRAYVAAQGRVD